MPRCEEPLAVPMEGVLMLEAAGESDEDDALEAACQERLACDLLLDFEPPRERTRHRTHRARNAAPSLPPPNAAEQFPSATAIPIAVKPAPARANLSVGCEPAIASINAKEQRTRKHADRRFKKQPQSEAAVLHSILKPAHSVPYCLFWRL